jgi:hypothetical protein
MANSSPLMVKVNPEFRSAGTDDVNAQFADRRDDRRTDARCGEVVPYASPAGAARKLAVTAARRPVHLIHCKIQERFIQLPDGNTSHDTGQGLQFKGM